jgi:hypothetical protein
MKKYNGWTNRETWNVMLWLNGIENLYFSMIEVLQDSKTPLSYRELIYALNLNNETTGDEVAYLSELLNYEELNESIIDIFNKTHNLS